MRCLWFLLFGLLAACSANRATQEKTSPQPSPTETIERHIFPDEEDWERYFKMLKELTELAKIPELRTTSLLADDFEIRVWYAVSFKPMECVIIRNSKGVWDAIFLKGNEDYKPTKVTWWKLPEPASGWDGCWQQLLRQEIFKLPGSVGEPFFDDSGYLVEVRKGGIYKPSVFYNPEHFSQKGAKEILEISNILSREFHLPHFDRTGEGK